MFTFKLLCSTFKVCVKSILNVCSEFVTPQKNVLLTTQPNLNAKKPRQVNKIRYQNLKKISSILCSQTLGACPVAETTPTRRKAAVSLNCLPSSSLFNEETAVLWSQPGIMHLRDEDIAS